MKFIPIAFTLTLLFFSFSSCSENKNTTINKPATQLEANPSMDVFKKMIVIFLSKEPDMDSNILDIQDFNENGKSFIPFFTSLESLKESTQNADLPYVVFDIDGLLFLSIMEGEEILRMNPTLKDDTYFKASDLKAHFDMDIKKMLKEMENRK